MTVLLCMGTRPEVIKMAPVVKALSAHGLHPVVMHTGQHEDMVWPLYKFFDIIPQHVITLKRSKPGLSELSAELLSAIDEVIALVKPRAMLVHGDTSSAAMGALAAFYNQVPVAHVEAGLRSGNNTEPFPEEMNRQLIGRIAQWHFAPTQGAVQSLARENTTTNVVRVGNTVVDAAQWAAARMQAVDTSASTTNTAGQWYARSGCKRLIVVTAHRRENWGAPMQDVLRAVVQLLTIHPHLAIVWPVHLNPIVKDAVTHAHAALDSALRARWHLTPPLHYPELIDLMHRCDVLLTDSGGIQEEAVALHKPVLILRNVTERPEVVECGLGQLVGSDTQVIVAAVEKCLAASEVQHIKTAHNPFGDGTAGMQIAQYLAQALSDQHITQVAA
jgi:UDP-N-acetylglucosamine 2-epimerase (non-hydrolysing)